MHTQKGEGDVKSRKKKLIGRKERKEETVRQTKGDKAIRREKGDRNQTYP